MSDILSVLSCTILQVEIGATSDVWDNVPKCTVLLTCEELLCKLKLHYFDCAFCLLVSKRSRYTIKNTFERHVNLLSRNGNVYADKPFIKIPFPAASE